MTDVLASRLDCEAAPSHMSDHHLLKASLPLKNKEDNPNYKLEGRSKSQPDREAFLRVLKIKNWDLKPGNINCKFNSFYDTFRYWFDVCFPVKLIRIKDSCQMGWTNEETYRSREQLEDLYWNTRNTNNPIAKAAYKTAKFDHIKLVSKTKQKFYSEKIEKAKNTSKETWSIVKSLTSENINNKSDNLVLKIDNRVINDPSRIVNEFNSFFVNEVQKLIADLNNSNTFHLNQGNSGDFHLRPTEIGEVIEVLCQFGSKTSSGIDEIPCNLLKDCREVIASPLVELINLSFSSGMFPEVLKLSKVIPIHKKDDVKILKNYRPVSVQSSFAKIFEIIFLRRLIPFIEHKNLLTENQYGFRKGRSTSDAIFAMLSEIFHKVDVLEEVLCIFYDLSKAFDLLNHNTLLEKMHNMGISGIPLRWVKSYLENRKMIVTINFTNEDNIIRKYKSVPSQLINTGVPQGSNLGPVLFLLFMNDMPDNVNNGQTWLFADDISHVISNENRELALRAAQSGLSEVSYWCESNNLILNKEKTVVLEFYNRKKPDCSPLLKLDDKSVKFNESIKYLGITLNTDLRWSEHIGNIAARLSSACYLLRRIQYLVSQEVLLKIYHGCFHSILNYGIMFWGASPEAERIFLLQKRAVRLLSKEAFLAHCRPLFKELRILTLPSQLIFECALYVKKNPDKFVTNAEIHQHRTRQAGMLHLSQNRTTLGQNSPEVRCIKVYNKLPSEVRNIQEIQKFKITLKKILEEKVYYSFKEFDEG